MLAIRTFGNRPNRLPQHERDGRLEDPTIGRQRLPERGVVALVRLRLPPHPVERLAVLRRAAVAMVRGERAALVHQRPEAVPGRVGGRPAVGRAGSQRDRLHALLEHELELRGGEVGIEHRDVGRRVQAVAVRVAPVLLQPQVERVEHLVGHRHVVVHEALDAVTEGREEQAPLHVLLVDHVDARVVDPVPLRDVLELAVRLVHVGERETRHPAGAVLQLLQARMEHARLRDRVEGRVRHAGVGQADHGRAEHHVAALALADPAHVPLHVFVAVAEERVLGLVVVVVGVDEHVVHDALLGDVGNVSLVERRQTYRVTRRCAGSRTATRRCAPPRRWRGHGGRGA